MLFSTRANGATPLEQMRISSAGNVGIGTSFPNARLHTNLAVVGSLLPYLNDTTTTFNTSKNIIVAHDSAALGTDTAAGLLLVNNNNSNNAISPIIAFSAKSASNGFNHTYAAIWGEKTGNGADSNWNSGSLVFAGSTGTGPKERMRIDASGNLSIGTALAENSVGVYAFGTSAELRIKDGEENGTAQISIYNVNTTNDSEQFFVAMNGADVDIGNKRQALKLFAGGSERMRITAEGHIYHNSISVGALHSSAVGSYVSAGATYASGMQRYQFTTTSDNVWRVLINDVRDTTGFMYVTLGDAASKDTASYTYNITSVPYGVSSLTNLTYTDGGFNTGVFEFRITDNSPYYNIEVRFSSYYSSANTATGYLLFNRLY
jgi:hypothetical protein